MIDVTSEGEKTLRQQATVNTLGVYFKSIGYKKQSNAQLRKTKVYKRKKMKKRCTIKMGHRGLGTAGPVLKTNTTYIHS